MRSRFTSLLRAPRAALSLMTTLALMLTAPSFACADPILTIGPGGGNPGENLLFNNASLLLGPATNIQGVTNQTNAVLDITSNVNLVGNGGQARIEGEGGAGFGLGGVTLTPHTANDLPGGLMPMGGFTELLFNIDATATGTVSFFVTTTSGVFAFIAQPLDDSGQNFFRFETTGSEYITQVTITSTGDITNAIEQIRLGNVVDPSGGPSPVIFTPEPTSLLAWGCVGLGMAGAAWRRRNRNAAAVS